MIPFADADARRQQYPIVNVTLIALNTLVFLYEWTLGGFGFLFGGGGESISAFFFRWGFIPFELTTGEAFSSSRFDIATPLPTWTTIFSSMFMHGGVLHYAGNMAFLWVFGNNIEDRMGRAKYLAFYLGTGVAATLSHLLVEPRSQVPLIGASGAISGVLGAYLFLYPYNRIKALVIIVYFVTVVQLPAMLLLGLWFLWQLVQGLGSVMISDAVSVAFWAHIGGFVAGAAVVAIYKLFTRQPIWPPRYRRPSGTRYWRGRPLD